MKRIVTLVLVLAMVLTMVASFTSCGGIDPKDDWNRVEDRGYFVCGITDYAPMNFKDDKGEWTGFDTDFAKAVAEYLGVEVRFFELGDWNQKYVELDSGNIDMIWNGFTYGDESDGKSRTEYVDFTYAYLENRQCLVFKTDKLATFATKESLAGATAVVEGSSSGEGVAKELVGDKGKVVTKSAQSAALMELKAGLADFAVIDYQMAVAMVGTGDYDDLSMSTVYEPESEVYAIGCRKESSLTAKINEAIKALSENGTLADIAEKYDLTNDLIKNIGA